MCLVSYVPTTYGAVLSSNRDEAPSRSVNELNKEQNVRCQIYYPQDTKGGSWFVFSDQREVSIVLNGAITNHKRVLPYRLSRGIMLKQRFDYTSIAEFIQSFDFENIEPFTLINYEGKKLIEFRWDGKEKLIEILNSDKSHVWSSCTLYSDDIIVKRKEAFEDLLKENNSESEVEQIHMQGSVDDPKNNFVMNREDRVRTVSFTQLALTEGQMEFKYHNLLAEETRTLKLNL